MPNHTPGPELNRLVAEAANLKVTQAGPDTLWWHRDDGVLEHWTPSTNIAQALEAAERIGPVDIESVRMSDGGYIYDVLLYDVRRGPAHERKRRDKSLALALSIAIVEAA